MVEGQEINYKINSDVLLNICFIIKSNQDYVKDVLASIRFTGDKQASLLGRKRSPRGHVSTICPTQVQQQHVNTWPERGDSDRANPWK